MSQLTTYDRAWTYVGVSLAATALSLAWFARTGALPLVSVDPAGDDLRIVAGYWGLLISSASLLALGSIATRYVKHRSVERLQEPPWPRLAHVEQEGRDAWISALGFLIVTGTLLGSWVVCLIRYFDSRVAWWAATSTGDALGQGFLSSRWNAFKEAPSGQPMLRIHPPEGHQYIPWLTDVFLLVLCVLAVAAWWLWVAGSLRHAHSTTPEGANSAE